MPVVIPINSSTIDTPLPSSSSIVIESSPVVFIPKMPDVVIKVGDTMEILFPYSLNQASIEVDYTN